ncbi:RNA-guided endonuclease TnpB family protein [Catenibacterium sp. GCM10023432]|uniref:RNA-guided endonuclease TnpB family protein n=2 Tax=Catenibacterium TaxID=135858 RepID=UPI00361F34E3
MEQMTITAKIQIIAAETDKFLLDETMSVYRNACNYVSDYVFRTHDLKQFSLNKALYSTLREKFNLKSQMAQSVLKTVIARYRTILENQNEWIKPSFKKPQYDLVWNRDYSLTQNRFSINTLNGRVKLSYFSDGMSKYFDHTIYKFGTAKLVSKHGKYYLHIPVTYEIEESNISDICNVVGIDRCINFVVATYDSKHKSGFVSGKAIGQRENRWMQDINHRVSKALVENNPKHTLFVLEDLSGIRNATERVKTKDRYVSVSWSFYDLEQKIIYKAKQNQSSVIKVDPRYTSQCCPCCGHVEKSNRNKKIHLFTCKKCGYKSNDDRIGAMNLYRMGIDYLADSQVPNTVVTE